MSDRPVPETLAKPKQSWLCKLGLHKRPWKRSLFDDYGFCARDGCSAWVRARHG